MGPLYAGEKLHKWDERNRLFRNRTYSTQVGGDRMFYQSIRDPPHPMICSPGFYPLLFMDYRTLENAVFPFISRVVL